MLESGIIVESLLLAGLTLTPKRAAVEFGLRDVWQRRAYLDLLSEYLYNLELQPALAMKSYIHDNGFYKIVLADKPSCSAKIRLHIWNPVPKDSPPRKLQNIHNHRWDFSSLILMGQARQLTYRFAQPGEVGETLEHYRYYARGEKEHYDVVYLGRAVVVPLSSDLYRAGQLYSMDNNILHRVNIPDDCTVITLVVTHETAGWVTNDLLTPKPLAVENNRLPSPPLGVEAVAEKVHSILSTLSKRSEHD
jgi:hypothetical protein